MRLVAALVVVLATLPAFAEDAREPARAVELVPSVHHGHSVKWKTGAIITFTSFGVGLIGGALVAMGALSGIDHPLETNGAMLWSGVAISAIGGGGIVVVGPALWLSGIGGPPDGK